MLSGQSLRVKGEVVLVHSWAMDGGAGGYIADHRDLVGVRILLLCHGAQRNAGQGNGSVLPSAFTMTPASSSPFMWKWTVEGGFEPHGLSQFPGQREGIHALR